MDQAERDMMELAVRKHGELKATPEVKPISAALGRSLHKFHQFASKPFGYSNPPGEMLSEALGIPATARTLERVGYGEPLTTGKGMTTKPRADTMDAAMTLAGVAPLTKGMPVGASIKPLGKDVGKFIEDVYSKYPVNPINPRQRAMVWGEGDAQQLGMFELKPSNSVRGGVELDWISGYPQREGVGTKTLKAIQEHAQEAGIPITLWPWDKGTVSQKALTKFYKQNGFEPATKGGKALVWNPKVEEIAPKAPSTQPFWYNPTNKKLAAFEESGMHNKVIQEPEFTSKLGTTTEDAMQETSPLLMGRHRGKTLDLMQVSSPTDESLATVREMLQSQNLAPEHINFSAGEHLYEKVPHEGLLNSKTLQDLKPYKAGEALEDTSKVVTAEPKEHKMLQGFYRGYAGDYDTPTAVEHAGMAFVSPQRRAGEYYANKRAKQTGQDPHLEMILADPFSGYSYGHSTTGTGAVEPITTRARQLNPEHIEGVTRVYAAGGAVNQFFPDTDQMQLALLKR